MTPSEEKRLAAVYTAATMLQGKPSANGSDLINVAERVLRFIEGQ